MGTAPVIARLDSAATGNSADGQIVRSVVDDAFGAMSANLLVLLRAKKINVSSSAIIDSLGNSVAAKTTSSKTTADSNFNGHESITFASAVLPYTMSAGGIGSGSGPVAMTNSFTVVAGIHTVSATQTLYGDTAGTSDSTNTTGIYIDVAGNFHMSIGSGIFSANAGPGVGATAVVWVSFDAATRIGRFGFNSSAVLAQTTYSPTRNGAGTGTVCYPFGYQANGGLGVGSMSFHRWALFGKAYANGAVPSDDAQFAALLATYTAYIL